jgi:formate dehydrogenase subunit gamma
VLRHDLLFRLAHWSIFVEGGLLVITGFELGGILGGSISPLSNVTVHEAIGIAFIITAAVYFIGFLTGGDYHWVSLRRIPYSFRFIIKETKGWFGVAPKPANPIAYDQVSGEYTEKLVPSVIVVFWSFAIIGVVMALTGLALAFPQQFGFIFTLTDLIGGPLTGVTGMAFMLTFHRLVTFLLVALVMMHVYASFIFHLVGSMITGKRDERIAPHVERRRFGLTTPLKLWNGEGRPLEEPTVPDPDISATGKTVVLGLGNRYLRDDGVGIAVAKELQRRNLGEGVLVRAHQTFDLWLLSEYSGASQLIIIDAVRSGSSPGTVSEYEVEPRPGPLDSLPGLHSLELHDLIDFASRTGLLSCPLAVIGVEPKDCSPGEGLSVEVGRSVPAVVALVVNKFEQRLQSIAVT